MEKKVSVIIPAYNAEKKIENAVRSVIDQSYRNIEIIVVDDGSTDETGLIIDKISNIDNRIINIHTKNNGVSVARNTALKYCTGEYLVFIDSDDEMKPNMIQLLVKKMNDDVDLVCGGYDIISSDGNRLFSQELSEFTCKKNNYYLGIAEMQKKKAFNVLWNKMFRMSIIKDHNIKMNPKIRMGEDLLFVIDYLYYITKEICCVSDVIYKYTLSQSGAQATIKKDDAIIDRINQLYELEPLYQKGKYPMDSIYAEQLRCIYTSLIETKNKKVILRLIHNDERCQKMMIEYKPEMPKYALFKSLLKTNSEFIISAFINFFMLIKKIRGNSFSWS